MKGLDVEEIKLNKRKGQHILIDTDVINRQIEYAKITKKDTVLEIGPGLGALTLQLAMKANKVIAIEEDLRLFSYLKNRVPNNVELINADVLEVTIPDFDIIVSNLPYQISSPVTFKLLKNEFQKGIIMYQKEFAQRMTAKQGEKGYSRLSINIYYKAKCRILEFVPKSAFNPVPDVDSAIVEIIPINPPFSVIDEEFFYKIVEGLFAQRRKKVKNSLKSLVEKGLRDRGAFGKSGLNEILSGIPFKDKRVEALTPENIGNLADELYISLNPK